MRKPLADVSASIERVAALLAKTCSDCDQAAGGRSAYRIPHGKMVRTRFTLLAGDCLGLGRPQSELISFCVELIHTASLLHDDCVDGAALRRGKPTANEKLGINRAVLLGDLVVSKALLISSAISEEALHEFIKAVERMAQGSLVEEAARFERLPTARYLDTLAMKTGALFKAAAVCCAGRGKQPERARDCGRIGEAAGISFQIIDDVLDFGRGDGATGKDALKDLTEGRLTLPVLLALDDARLGPGISRRVELLGSRPCPDFELAAETAGLIARGGFLEKAREGAVAVLKGIEGPLERLPQAESASALRDYLWALAERGG